MTKHTQPAPTFASNHLDPDTPSGPPQFEWLDEGHYRLATGDGHIALEVEHVEREHREMHGELSVYCDLPGVPTIDGVLSVGTFNLSSPRARNERVGLLAVKAKTKDPIHWDGLLEELCQRVIKAEREGQPAVHLRDVEPTGPADVVDLDGCKLALAHPNCDFGDGDSLKSMLNLYRAGRLAQLGIRPLYLDWEFEVGDHRDRFGRMFADMPDVLYRRCERPLVHDADNIRRIVRAEQINFLFCDSVAFACDGPPEKSEVAAGYFRALRSIGVGSQSIAHVTKAAEGDQKPFGSVFWHNGFRSTWFVQRSSESADASRVVVGCFHRKCNIGPRQPAAGFQFAFDPTETLVRRVDIAAEADFAARVPLWQQLASALRPGAKTLAALALELDAKVDSIEKVVTRSKGRMFTRLSGADGITKIGLIDRRPA
jgi:hypothetical protein